MLNEADVDQPKARRLGWVSIAETFSFLALAGAMVAHNERLISTIGAVHGLLFLAYAFFVWMDHEDLGWTRWFAIGSVITGPLGAMVVLERLRRDGVWKSVN